MYMVNKYLVNESRQVEICESCLESGPDQHGLGALGEPVGDGPGWCEGQRHEPDQADAADAHDRLSPAEYEAWLAEAASSTDAIALAGTAEQAEKRFSLADATRAQAQADASFAARAHADASAAAVFASDYRYDDATKLARIARETFAASVEAERALVVADRDYREALAIVGAA